MMYVLLYALCRGRGLYDVTVGIIKQGGTSDCGVQNGYYDNDDVGGVLFVCFLLLCYMSVFSFVGLQYGDCPLMGGYSEQGGLGGVVKVLSQL